MKNQHPKLLVLANNSLSENNSNGRTLAGFLKGWDKESIAQIYISGEIPSSKVCDNFFQITDVAVLKGFFKKNTIGNQVSNAVETNNNSDVNKLSKGKSILKIVLRDILWGTNVWWNKKLKDWINDFSPDILLFFAGESVFTYKMAMKIAKYCDVPIVVYNSEAYYFKEKNYLKNGGVLSDLIYPLFHSDYRRIFRKLMKKAVHTVYINDKLKNDYDNEFNLPSTTIYTASDVGLGCEKEQNSSPVVSYLGNLGVGRHIALVEIAEALKSVNSDYKLNVYGKIPNDNVKKAFDNCSAINYCGLIPYSEVLEVMHKSDLLVHGESFDDFTVWDLKYAFTTKVADSLSCGTCFFVYAPKELACTEYLLKNECACVVTDKNELRKSLEQILTDEKLRNEYIQKGLEIARRNHNSEKNCEKFKEILISAVK